ncbi:bifunctional proline dehydrogenase/L-glutamate gamma-semialdehyde dehydrogenase PutA [Proteobacteria bacterium 005FR1]|nr:bifunctional proline dehydrogenase/L-glutamate gamma-semialdehyde dehydrogenase PutA [Proteobacteria bacterium 005FR1]
MPSPLSELQTQIAQQAFWDEVDCVKELFKNIELSPQQRARISERAETLINRSRKNKHKRDPLDAFLEQFGLNTTEGIALMCLAEALLRIPDPDTADKLIQEKLLKGNWQQHLGQSKSNFVNASTWGLLFTGKWLRFEESQKSTRKWLNYFFDRFSEPVLRKVMLQAMRIMGNQYILGRSIEEALRRLPKEYPGDTLFSFDALGEGARTRADADRHFAGYQSVIAQLGDYAHGLEAGQQHGVSIKLSALHPRYQWTQRDRVHRELLPKVVALAIAAREADVALSIDAEEAERLDICLDIFAQLALNPKLKDWPGLGFVLQAYQKRAVLTADWLSALAKQRAAPLNVRLVKGAYWDREIKRTQQMGLPEYPVFTRKANTDLSYLVCAKQLLDADADTLYPQFATHNATTIASIFELAGERPFELQRLHGMGELLYDQLDSAMMPGRKLPPVRVYAPVGNHPDLLPYLVRRLLENGANSSFVNQFLDEALPAHRLAIDALSLVEASQSLRNARIPLPEKLFSHRANSRGLDLENPADASKVTEAVAHAEFDSRYQPLISGGNRESEGQPIIVHNPANRSELSLYQEADENSIDGAIQAAATAQRTWDLLGGYRRAELLDRIAQKFEENKLRLIGLICREAGRTLVDAEAEVREAIDFCYYYGQQARRHFSAPEPLESPTGEENSYSLHGRGVFLCISPWNFPMAIFVGQVTAALAAGNTVIAKPAEQTTLVGIEIVRLMFEAGLPENVLHLLPGDGARLGPKLLKHRRVAGVAFTGSTETARIIHQQLAQRPGPIIPLIAETGGINTMLVDSTALTEQVVDDVLKSAFYSAGQRCSALRVLYLQEDSADQVLEMLYGACDQLTIGDPSEVATDIGPIIDGEALTALQDYVEHARKSKRTLYRYETSRVPKTGHFIGPHIFEVDKLADVDREIFGPVLHVIRYRREQLKQIIDDINHAGYGLTLGIHSRIEGWAESIFQRTQVGNTYVNRNMIGAVVGVQPFGGHNLSGTGPKAGGPHYLFQFAAEKVLTVNTVATGGNAALFNLGDA